MSLEYQGSGEDAANFKLEGEKPRTIDLLEEIDTGDIGKTKEEQLADISEWEKRYREYLAPDTGLDLLESIVEKLKALEERRRKLH